MKRLMLSAVVLGLALAGCDYGDPRLPFPASPADETGSGTGTGGGGGTTVTPPDAGTNSDGGVAIDGGTNDGGANDGGMTDGGVAVGGNGGKVGSVAEVARANPDLELFMRSIDMAGMSAELQDPTAKVTVFAPTNAAFAQMLTDRGSSKGLEGMSADQLRTFLRYHVLPAKVSVQDAVDAAATSKKLEAKGGKIAVAVLGGVVQLDRTASVTTGDIQATNGLIHVIDRVLFPSITDVLTTSTDFSSFASAVKTTDRVTPSPGLTKRLDNDTETLTLFVPPNAAMDTFVDQLKGLDDGRTTGVTSLESFRPDQLQPIVQYHLIESEVFAKDLRPGKALSMGGTLELKELRGEFQIDDTPVTSFDLFCSNGVIHVVKAVLMPSLTDIISTDQRFRALSAAITAADSDPTIARPVGAALDSPNDFTFFAPSNAAFNAFGRLMEGAALSNLLFFHAVPGSPIYSARASTFTTPVTLQTSIDKPLVLTSSGNPPKLTLTDGAGAPAIVTQVDVFAKNGVLHMIDRVLVPPP